MGNEADVLETIAKNTQSELILFFIIVALLTVPIYVLLLKNRKHRNQFENERRSQYMEREKEVLKLIANNSDEIKNVIINNTVAMTNNTSAIAKLETTLERDRREFHQSVVRIHDRIDESFREYATHGKILSHISVKLDEVLRKEKKNKSIFTSGGVNENN